ncbi:hypothetical protein PRZ48_009037 [Zasmidium cellare]|uniref:Uncharacterized protein n=1 Tax=Zasmidium cellare TaxID=395010 RepID=A0ABR0EHU7_ZASCE|nr:hypothetical protein PRZ48_009037 [Zasmidium cellare]
MAAPKTDLYSNAHQQYALYKHLPTVMIPSSQTSAGEKFQHGSKRKHEKTEHQQRAVKSPKVDQDMYYAYRQAMVDGIAIRDLKATQGHQAASEAAVDQGGKASAASSFKTTPTTTFVPSAVQDQVAVLRPGLWKPFWQHMEGRTQAEIERAEGLIMAKWPIPSRPSVSPLTPPPKDGEEKSNEDLALVALSFEDSVFIPPGNGGDINKRDIPIFTDRHQSMMTSPSTYQAIMSQKMTELKEAQAKVEDGFLQAYKVLCDLKAAHASLEVDETKTREQGLEDQAVRDADLNAREKQLCEGEQKLEKSKEEVEEREKELRIRCEDMQKREEELRLREAKVKEFKEGIPAAISAYQRPQVGEEKDQDTSKMLLIAAGACIPASDTRPQEMSGMIQSAESTLASPSPLPKETSGSQKVIIIKRRRDQQVVRITTGGCRPASPATRARMAKYKYVYESDLSGDESDMNTSEEEDEESVEDSPLPIARPTTGPMSISSNLRAKFGIKPDGHDSTEFKEAELILEGSVVSPSNATAVCTMLSDEPVGHQVKPEEEIQTPPTAGRFWGYIPRSSDISAAAPNSEKRGESDLAHVTREWRERGKMA